MCDLNRRLIAIIVLAKNHREEKELNKKLFQKKIKPEEN